MPVDVVRALGAWGEEYEIASGEDVDLCFKVWVNDLDVVYDQRVLVRARRQGLGGRGSTTGRRSGRANRRRFLEKWMGDGDGPAPRRRATPTRFARNRETARSVAGWMERYFTVRDREDRRNRRFFAKNGPGPHALVRLGARGVAPGPAAAAGARWRTGSARPRARVE